MSTPAVSNTLASLLSLSPNGPLESVYQYLTPTGARQFSVTCREARRIFTNEEVQRALVNIHFPAMANGPPISSRGLFLRASVGKNHPTEALKILVPCTERHCCTKISAGGTKVLSEFSDNSLKLWDLTTGTWLKNLVGHESFINCLQISADGTKALSGSSDCTLKLWDLITGECVRTLIGHTDSVFCLQMSADGTRALSGSRDDTLKFWDLNTGRCLQTLVGHQYLIRCLQMSMDGTRALSGSSDDTLKFWDLTTGTCLQTLRGHRGAVRCLQMSADGTKALSGSCDSDLRLWDLNTGACLKILLGHRNLIKYLELCADEAKALSGSYDGDLKLWDLNTGKCLQTLSGHGSAINFVQMSRDGTKALSGSCDKTLKLWDLITGTCLQTLSGHKDMITCLQMSADGTKAISGSSDSTVRFWNLIPDLPLERIAKVARSFFENRVEARALFSKLPSFVQERITTALDKISPNQEPRCSFALGEINQVFADYMKRQFLPDVAEYLETLEQQNSSLRYTESTLFKEALECLDQLSIPIKNAVYKELYEVQKTANTLPGRMPSNYGDLAFHETGNYTATLQERIQAIRNVMVS